MKNLWLLFFVFILFAIILIMIIDNHRLQHQLQVLTEAQATFQQIPTQAELQQMLVNKGYDVGGDGVDGIVGANTIKGWELWECQQHAKKWDWMYQEK